MTADLSSVARVAAEQSGHYPETMLGNRQLQRAYALGFTECASRIPNEEELARVIDAAIYVSINPLLDRGAWKAAQRAARDVASLIGEKISG